MQLCPGTYSLHHSLLSCCSIFHDIHLESTIITTRDPASYHYVMTGLCEQFKFGTLASGELGQGAFRFICMHSVPRAAYDTVAVMEMRRRFRHVPR
jgi:hypothetical protein